MGRCLLSPPLSVFDLDDQKHYVFQGIGLVSQFLILVKEQSDLKNYFHATINFITEYNRIQYKMAYGQQDTSDQEDEFIQDFSENLAEALMHDVGESEFAQRQLYDSAKIICEEYKEKEI